MASREREHVADPRHRAARLLRSDRSSRSPLDALDPSARIERRLLLVLRASATPVAWQAPAHRAFTRAIPRAASRAAFGHTRGMKGCYVDFTDDATRNFVLSRLERKRG
jgi:hypothetical protein